MVYETGCQGMVIASALERLGFLGKIVHIYQTGSPQTQSISAMNFGTDKEKLHEVLMTINMYHLRSLEQGKDITHMHSNSSVRTKITENNKYCDLRRGLKFIYSENTTKICQNFLI